MGCEVLAVDAEGYDTKILRSLIAYCRKHPEQWPELIPFETMGHCDRHEEACAEQKSFGPISAGGVHSGINI